jgi:hypothetical protein
MGKDASMSSEHHIATTDAELHAAVARGRLAAASLPSAVRAQYDASDDSIVISLRSGVMLIIPRRLLQGLEQATPEQLRDIELVGPGTGLHWPRLDVDHYLPGLIQGLFGTREWMAEIGQKGGRVRSIAKAAAARRNGQRGGRPSRQPIPTAVSDQA